MRIAITGANGYIGRALLRRLPADWEPVCIGRRAGPGRHQYRFADLSRPMPEGLLDGVDAVVHLAADTADGGTTAEIAFARSLALEARRLAIPLVFVSSQAASPDAPSGYGRTKAAIESEVLPLGASVVRPGMVYGGQELGLFGTLCRFARASPLLPALLPAPPVQPIHVADLADAILAILAVPDAAGRIYPIAGPPMSFNAFFRAIAAHRARSSRLIVPVPVALLKLVLRAARAIGIEGLRPERLDSLVSLPVMDARADMRELGIVPRPLRAGLARSGSGDGRSLLAEGRALGRSLVGTRIGGASLARYAKALRAHGRPRGLGLPRAAVAFPLLLTALDRQTWRRSGGELAWRLQTMSRICESDPALTGRFLWSGSRLGLLGAALGFASAASVELAARLLSPMARLMMGRISDLPSHGG